MPMKVPANVTWQQEKDKQSVRENMRQTEKRIKDTHFRVILAYYTADNRWIVFRNVSNPTEEAVVISAQT